MAILSNCVVALALASCVTVATAAVHNPYDDQYYAAKPGFTETKYYKPPCKFNYKYNPTELASVYDKIYACLKSLPGVQWPTDLPSLDCTVAGVNSLRNAKSRTLSGVPAAVQTCLQLDRYESLLKDTNQINKAVACVKGVKL